MALDDWESVKWIAMYSALIRRRWYTLCWKAIYARNGLHFQTSERHEVIFENSVLKLPSLETEVSHVKKAYLNEREGSPICHAFARNRVKGIVVSFDDVRLG